jgi:hypothetical protein
MAVTPNYGWPVPVATDFVKDGYEAIADLGDAIDATVFGLPSGALTFISSTTIGSAVASVTVTGAFSATYDNYKIVLSKANCSTQGTNFSLTLNGSTGSTYAWAGNYTPYGGANVIQSGASQSLSVLGVTGTDNTNTLFVEIASPFLTERTTFSSNYADNSFTGRYGGFDNNAVSHTAFTIGVQAGTLTGGTIRVYGYQNS